MVRLAQRIITGDQLTAWDIRDDRGERAPVAQPAASGASDPMAISLAPFERQFLDFGEACKTGREPACSGVDGYRALQLVRAIYTSCAEERKVDLTADRITLVSEASAKPYPVAPSIGGGKESRETG